jgi:hypothetical protein
MSDDPNLFDFATSELSQDAILCWMAKWAEARYAAVDPLLHKLGRDFLSLMLAKHERILQETVEKLVVRRQFKHIDVLLEVDDFLLISIEDKVGTSEHSGQLARYLSELQALGHPSIQILPIYVQTGNQSSFKQVEKQGYRVVNRGDFVRLFSTYLVSGGRSDIISNYYRYLLNIEAQFRGFCDRPLDKWTWWNWIGFYSAIQERVIDGSWNYVPNQSGGFLGFWWAGVGDNGFHWYLQLEETDLVVKIGVNEKSGRSAIRDSCLRRVLSVARSMDLPFKRPGRVGHGQTMTVAVLASAYRRVDASGRLDMEATLAVLRDAELLIRRCPSESA